MPENESNAEESIATPLEIYIGTYNYIGIDSEGYHHHADKKNARILVTTDAGEQVGEYGGYIRLEGDVDHVQHDDGFKFAYGLEEWADHVADVRGWQDRQLETYPELREAFLNGGMV